MKNALPLALAASLLLSGMPSWAEDAPSAATPTTGELANPAAIQPDQAQPAAGVTPPPKPLIEIPIAPVDTTPDANKAETKPVVPVTSAGGDWTVHRATALKLFQDGKIKEAQKELEITLQMAKAAGASQDVLGDIQMNLGTAYQVDKQYDKAIAEYSRFVEAERQMASPNNEQLSRALNNIGSTYRAQKKYEQALTYLLQAKLAGNEKMRGYNEVLLSLGLTYQAMKRYPEAENYLKQAILQSKTGVNASARDRFYCQRALIGLSLEEGNVDKYELAVKDALPTAVGLYGDQSAQAKDLRLGLQKVQQAKATRAKQVQIANASKQWNAFMTSGNQKMNAKQFKQATVDFEKALKVVNVADPKGQAAGITRGSLGSAYFQLKDYARAETHLGQAVAIIQKQDPKSKDLPALQKGYQLAKTLHQGQPAASPNKTRAGT